MSDRSKIEWTEATWNPVRGCSRVSEGCRHCYAERHAARFGGAGLPFEGFAVIGTDGPHWTGRVELVRDKLTEPLRWKRPRRIFVNSMSDLFHEGLDDDAIAVVFAVMACCPQHTFQVLTKRPERMREWVEASEGLVRHVVRINRLRGELPGDPDNLGITWPLPNVWLGVSVEDQETAAARLPLLLQTPAAVRFVSAEPLLGPVDLEPWLRRVPTSGPGWKLSAGVALGIADVVLDWVIVGGESGPGARPMHPDWARSMRDQCEVAGVAYFFKQWGAWVPIEAVPMPLDKLSSLALLRPDGSQITGDDPVSSATASVWLAGKHAAGRLLDGREHNDMPGHLSRATATVTEPDWACSACGWTGEFGEAAFTMSLDDRAFCPQCERPLMPEAVSA